MGIKWKPLTERCPKSEGTKKTRPQSNFLVGDGVKTSLCCWGLLCPCDSCSLSVGEAPENCSSQKLLSVPESGTFSTLSDGIRKIGIGKGVFGEFCFVFYSFILFILFLAALGLRCWAQAFSLVAVRGGYSSLWCPGFSLQWLLLLWSTGSRREGFSSCDSRVLECRLSSCGTQASVVVAHGLQ